MKKEETMSFCIDDMGTNNEIYRQTIHFDENHFMNCVKKKENEKCRDQKLLDIANKIMLPLNSDI